MHRFVEVSTWGPSTSLNIIPGHVVMRAVCGACGEEREFPRSAVPSGFTHARVPDIEKALRCTSCNHKGGKLRFGYYAVPFP